MRSSLQPKSQHFRTFQVAVELFGCEASHWDFTFISRFDCKFLPVDGPEQICTSMGVRDRWISDIYTRWLPFIRPESLATFSQPQNGLLMCIPFDVELGLRSKKQDGKAACGAACLRLARSMDWSFFHRKWVCY